MKSFNKIISLITVAVLVLSMMAMPAFAVTAVDTIPSATGGEKVTVTYYSDAALSTPITSANKGDEIYAKVTLNIPGGMFRAFSAAFVAENATIEQSLDTFTASKPAELSIFEYAAVGNGVATDKASAKVFISKSISGVFDSPKDAWADYEIYGVTGPWYSNVGIYSFDVNAYKLKVTGDTGKVALNLSESELHIGEFDEALTCDFINTPFKYEDAGVTIGGSEPAKKKVSYSAAWTDSSVTYDESLDDEALKAAIKANLTVKKLVDGTPESTNPVYEIVMDRAAKTIKVTITDTLLADEELAGGAEKAFNLNFDYTAKPDTYTLKSIKFGAEDITGKTEFDVDYTNYKTLGDVANAITVTMLKNGTDEVPAALGSDYVLNSKFVENANRSTLEIKFESLDGTVKSSLDGTAAKTFVANWKNTEIVWSNITKKYSPESFSFAKSTVTEQAIKDGIIITGDRKDGFKDVEVGIKLTEGVHYTVTVPADLTKTGEVIVTFNDIDNLKSVVHDFTKTFEITEDEITWSDYEASFKDVTTFTGKETDDYIKGNVVVKALRRVNGTPDTAKTEISGYNVAITRAEGDNASKAVITFGDGEHKGAAVDDLTFTVQPNYDTVIADMTKTSFAEGATDEEILNAMKVTAKKWFYGSDKPELAETVTLERGSDYTAVLEGNTVRISAAGADFNEVIGKTFTIVKGAKATAVIAFTNATDNKINKGTALKGKLSLDTTENIYGGKITLSTTKGEFDEFTINSNCEIKNVDKTVSGKYTFEFTKKAGAASVSDIGTFTINTDSMNKDDEIKVEVESVALDTVGAGDFVDVPSAKGDAKTATVTETAPAPTEAKLPDASFDIKTLGALNSVIDRFKDAVTLVNTTDSSVVADAAALKAAITIDETDLNNKKLVIKDLTVPALSTTAYNYELAVAVPGYTKAKVTFTVTYNETTNNYDVTGGTVGEGAKKNTIYAGDNDSDNTITATSVTANDYANLVAKFGEAVTGNEAFDIYQNAETTIDRYDIMTMVWMFENYGMKLVSEAGIIAD